jgi:hypothetical protein
MAQPRRRTASATVFRPVRTHATLAAVPERETRLSSHCGNNVPRQVNRAGKGEGPTLPAPPVAGSAVARRSPGRRRSTVQPIQATLSGTLPLSVTGVNLGCGRFAWLGRRRRDACTTNSRHTGFLPILARAGCPRKGPCRTGLRCITGNEPAWIGKSGNFVQQDCSESGLRRWAFAADGRANGIDEPVVQPVAPRYRGQGGPVCPV